jgi:hypothetical protein
MLADCFYLPHEDGALAQEMLATIERLLIEPPTDWGDNYDRFLEMNTRIQALFDRLTELRDRELFEAWSRRVWELKEELLVLEAALAQKKAGHDLSKGVELEICLPGTFRGGILAKLQRFLAMDALGNIRSQTSST